MDFALDAVQILVCVVLLFAILSQSKGSGFSGAFGGDSGSIYRTRRGMEKTLFQFTIIVAVVFLVISVIALVVE